MDDRRSTKPKRLANRKPAAWPGPLEPLVRRFVVFCLVCFAFEFCIGLHSALAAQSCRQWHPASPVVSNLLTRPYGFAVGSEYDRFSGRVDRNGCSTGGIGAPNLLIVAVIDNDVAICVYFAVGTV